MEAEQKRARQQESDCVCMDTSPEASGGTVERARALWRGCLPAVRTWDGLVRTLRERYRPPPTDDQLSALRPLLAPPQASPASVASASSAEDDEAQQRFVQFVVFFRRSLWSAGAGDGWPDVDWAGASRLATQPWFHGPVNKNEAYTRVSSSSSAGGADGRARFLVRYSDSNWAWACYTLTRGTGPASTAAAAHTRVAHHQTDATDVVVVGGAAGPRLTAIGADAAARFVWEKDRRPVAASPEELCRRSFFYVIPHEAAQSVLCYDSLDSLVAALFPPEQFVAAKRHCGYVDDPWR